MKFDTVRTPVNTVARSFQPTYNTHLVKYEDLNHHRTLFAGRGAEWLIEASFIAAARCVGKPEDVVCVQIQGMTFKKPAWKGDLVEVVAQIGHLGGKSLTVIGKATINGDPASVVTCLTTFVTTNGEGKAYAHGISLPQAYVEEFPEVCETARKAYESAKR
ncbi:MAG: hotdog domain-containing protein [Planctomycetota bacterium]